MSTCARTANGNPTILTTKLDRGKKPQQYQGASKDLASGDSEWVSKAYRLSKIDMSICAFPSRGDAMTSHPAAHQPSYLVERVGGFWKTIHLTERDDFNAHPAIHSLERVPRMRFSFNPWLSRPRSSQDSHRSLPGHLLHRYQRAKCQS